MPSRISMPASPKAVEHTLTERVDRLTDLAREHADLFGQTLVECDDRPRSVHFNVGELLREQGEAWQADNP